MRSSTLQCERWNVKYFLTVRVPVEADSPQDAKDYGWEKLIQPDGPPEGLVEAVSTIEAPMPPDLAAL